jgi:uncharacterized protein YciW
MTKQRRDLIRHEKTRWQKARVTWKKANPILAAEKTQANLMDSARRAVARGDRELARALKAENKFQAYLKRRAEREEARNLKGAAKPKAIVKPSIFKRIGKAFNSAINRMTRIHRPAGGARIAGAK